MKYAKKPKQPQLKWQSFQRTQRTRRSAEWQTLLKRTRRRFWRQTKRMWKLPKLKGVKAALLDRLALDQKKIQTMAKDMREVSALADPIGTIISTWTRPNGLIISQVRVPLGVVGVIYESRPNVTSDSAGICIKSGNAVILRGGSDALNSNVAIGEVLRDALAGTDVPVDAIQVVNSPDRKVAEELMRHATIH